MKNWIKVIIGILIGIMMTSGCVTTQRATAQEIKALVLNVYDAGDITSFQITIEGIGTLTTTNSSGTFVVEGPFNATGMVDVANRKLMREDRTVNLFYPDIEQHTLVYIIGDIIYMGTYSDEDIIWNNWSVGSLSSFAPDEWALYSVLELYDELRNCSNEELLEDDIVGGVECYVLQVTPDLELWAQRYGLEWQEGSSDFDIGFKYWIAKDTSYIIKVQQTTSMDVSSVFGPPGGGGEDTIIWDIYGETIFSDYNSPVTIELPPEAM